MRRRRFKIDPDKVLLVEQALKLTPSERLQLALGMLEFALRVNPKLKDNREFLLAQHQSTRRDIARRHDEYLYSNPHD